MATRYLSRTFRDIWITVEIFKRMETSTTDKDERRALRFSSMLLLFFSFEAYLNHLGEKIAPEIWKNERKNFNGKSEINGEKYPGPIGKFTYLQLLCGISDDSVITEIEIVKELKKFRDLLAHGKTEEVEIPYSCKHGAALEIYTPIVWELINSNLLERSFLAIKCLLCTTHSAALAAFPDSGLEPSPFVSSFFQITDVISSEEQGMPS